MDAQRAAAGSLGPRLAGRLTAELILRSPQYMNCVKDYEIDLRGERLHTMILISCSIFLNTIFPLSGFLKVLLNVSEFMIKFGCLGDGLSGVVRRRQN
jgi:hypothetical protein